MKLPNPDKAIIAPDKIRGYLLSPVHSVGRHKAVFFNSLGYTQDEWDVLARDLQRFVTHDAEPTEETAFGRKYVVRATLTGPTGRSARIVTAWIVRHGEDFARFITAHPEV